MGLAWLKMQTKITTGQKVLKTAHFTSFQTLFCTKTAFFSTFFDTAENEEESDRIFLEKYPELKEEIN